MNFFDRQIGGALAEPIRKEWNLSDGALGALGTAFTLLYAFVGIPLGRLSDRSSRKRILSVAVLVWSALTSLSAVTRSFWQMFATRLGVGVGEAACAPAATSLIGDLYPPARRARALSIFMLGLPIGIALSYLVSSFVAHTWGWRAAFFVAGIPGVHLRDRGDVHRRAGARHGGDAVRRAPPRRLVVARGADDSDDVVADPVRRSAQLQHVCARLVSSRRF